MLPGFDHWVLDTRFLEVDGLLAIGLSDNSVALWDLSKRALVTRVKSPEKCLLYSMRMWGDSVREFLVASGTILNEILI
uniref:Transducin family protein / WD-40 repeat family protein n=2 Tax=Zea mays TaxID=4577 RepID=A0A804PI99_MAIZE